MERIFLAGSAGLVGNAFSRRLERNESTILLSPKSDALDLTRQDRVEKFFEREKPSSVILAAGKVGGIQANLNFPAEFIYRNLVITGNVIHQAWKSSVDRLLFFGSGCMYPKHCPQPMKETSLLSGFPEPTSEPYAVAKIAGWKLCESYNQQYETKFRCVIPANLYGPGDRFDSGGGHVIPALIRRFDEAKDKHAKEVVVWGSGNAKREFLFVEDLVEACLFLEEHPDVLGPINVGSNQETSVRRLAELIKEIAGFPGKLVFDASKPDGMPLKKLDGSKIEALGWRSKTALEDGLESTYQWYSKFKESRRNLNSENCF